MAKAYQLYENKMLKCKLFSQHVDDNPHAKPIFSELDYMKWMAGPSQLPKFQSYFNYKWHTILSWSKSSRSIINRFTDLQLWYSIFICIQLVTDSLTVCSIAFINCVVYCTLSAMPYSLSSKNNSHHILISC